MTLNRFPLHRLLLAAPLFIGSCAASPEPANAQAPTTEKPAAFMVEAEDFKPQASTAPGSSTPIGWKVVKNGEGNYMVDIVGFQHISGERELSAPANAKNAVAVKDVQIPAAGTYRVWSRFEQPTETDNQFRVEIKQNGKVVGSAVMGERTAPKYFFGATEPVGQADPSWGSEGLVEQSFDVQNLQKGAAQIVLTALDQSNLPAPRANRNIDFLFLTQDLTESWREQFSQNRLYPILDAAQASLPPRYYLRLSSPQSQNVQLRYILNRLPWYVAGPSVKLEANAPSEWIPLDKQDVAHFTTLQLSDDAKNALQLRAEFASAPDEKKLIRAIDWNDAKSNQLLVGLPPYPNKYAGEKIITVEEQYRAIADYLSAHPSKVGKEPIKPLAWGQSIPVWEQGKVGDAAANVYFGIGMRVFAGFVQPPNIQPQIEAAKLRFQQRGLQPNRSVALGKYRFSPTAENIAEAKKAAIDAGVLPLVQRFDYGDEIAFSEWLAPLTPEQIKDRFAVWQQRNNGKVAFETPDSSAKAAQENPILYVDSLKFYDEAAISSVAELAREIPKQLGADVLYGANFAAHPFYYPEIAKYVKWFRPTENGDYAANFGRHSEYIWQVGQPGSLANAYVADHFRSGMSENPKAQLLQYTMPHSPGNNDLSFRRSAFSHLAHGAKGLDYFGIGVNNSFTENYIDFRDQKRYAAIRDVNRSMASIEDILPQSKVVPSRVALVLSDSTERWDFAGIAKDKAGLEVFGADYKKTRLAFHMDRLGIYYALVHSSHPPDLLIEEDVQAGKLKDYDVAYWVGDCAESKTVSSLRNWVESGGHLVATAGALRFDEYKRPTDDGLKLLGLQSAKLDAKEWFFRPQIELPRMTPIDGIATLPVFGAKKMPVLAVKDEVTAMPDAKVFRTFNDGQPAIVTNTLGKGKTTFIAALPGVAYLWSAYQKAGGKDFVPARGPTSHMELSGFDSAAGYAITAAVRTVFTSVDAGGAKIDARLLSSPKGYAIPLANYENDVSKPVTLTIRGVKNVKKISSVRQGTLKFQTNKDGSLTIKYAPGVGDILRLD